MSENWTCFIHRAGLLILSTRFYEVDLPVWRFFGGGKGLDPATLHLAGEFVENILGTARESDGSYTVRLIAQQYLFVRNASKFLPEFRCIFASPAPM